MPRRAPCSCCRGRHRATRRDPRSGSWPRMRVLEAEARKAHFGSPSGSHVPRRVAITAGSGGFITHTPPRPVNTLVVMLRPVMTSLCESKTPSPFVSSSTVILSAPLTWWGGGAAPRCNARAVLVVRRDGQAGGKRVLRPDDPQAAAIVEIRSTGCRMTGSDATRSIVNPSISLNARRVVSGGDVLSPSPRW